jgi:hypothetical protein
MRTDLTDKYYWNQRHIALDSNPETASQQHSWEWMPIVLRLARMNSSRMIQVAATLSGAVLPYNHPYFAPWMLYIGQKLLVGER